MENIESYGIEFELHTKQMYKDLKKYERKMKAFEKRLQRNARRQQQQLRQGITATAQHENRTRATTAQRTQRTQRASLTAEQRLERKRLADALRAERKEAQRVRKFEAWKLTQLRGSAFAQLNITQQMNLRRVLNSQQSEEQIRAQWARSTSILRREQLQRARYERTQATARRRANGGSGGNNGAGGGGGMMLLGGGMAMAGMAAATVAIAGGVMVKKGADEYSTLKNASEGSGASVSDLQKEAFVNRSLLGAEFGVEKTADMATDTNDRRGELLRDLEMKDGKMTSGGSGADLANLLISKGVINGDEASVRDYFKGDDALKLQTKMFADLEKSGVSLSEAQFALESFVSDGSKLYSAKLNKERVANAESNYSRLNVALTDDDVKRMDQVSASFSTLTTSLSNFPLKIFASFTEALSPEAQANLQKLGELLMRLADPVGKLLGLILDLILTGLTPLMDVFSVMTEGFSFLVDGMLEGWNKFKELRDPIIKFFTDFVKDILSLLPNFLLPEELQSKKDEAPTTTPTANPNTPYYMQQPIKPYTPYGTGESVKAALSNGSGVGNNAMVNGAIPPPQMVTPPLPQTASQQGQRGVNVNMSGESVSNITLTLDSEVVAEAMSKSPIFKGAINQEIYTTMY